MADDQAQWSAMGGSGSGGGGGAPSMTAPTPPPAPMPEMSGKGKKEKRAKEPKAPKARATTGGHTNADIGLLSFAAGPSREQMEREAADELMAALTPSYQLLRNEVPDAASPDDAQRRIEGQLDRYVPDNDHEVPRHPIYDGDALVYQQLRRHYGSVQPGNSLGRLGGGLRRGDSIHRNMTAADEWGNLHRR